MSVPKDNLQVLLSSLAIAEPDPGRDRRTRARCHGSLARHRPQPRRSSATRVRWEVAGVTAFSLAYLVVVIRQALH